MTPPDGTRVRGPESAPRRLLTDWTTTAGVAGHGLAALVAAPDAVPEAVHLATLGYATFLVDSSIADAELPSTVHAVDVGPTLPGEWHERFGLVLSEPAQVERVRACLAPAGLLVVIGEAGQADAYDPATLTEVARDLGPDPDAPGAERFRAVYARL